MDNLIYRHCLALFFFAFFQSLFLFLKVCALPLPTSLRASIFHAAQLFILAIQKIVAIGQLFSMLFLIFWILVSFALLSLASYLRRRYFTCTLLLNTYMTAPRDRTLMGFDRFEGNNILQILLRITVIKALTHLLPYLPV